MKNMGPVDIASCSLSRVSHEPHVMRGAQSSSGARTIGSSDMVNLYQLNMDKMNNSCWASEQSLEW